MSTVLFVIGSPWMLWVFYTAVMRLKQVRDAGGLTTAQKMFGYLALFVGLLLDAVVHLVIGSLVFMERPREWTLSGRLWRLSQGPEGWRRKRAIAIRVALLDSIDPSGVHKG